MNEHELARIEGEIDRALQRASGLGLELVVYILTMAKLELANEIGDRKLMRLFEGERVAPLQ
jgi:hypothetical protein